MRESVSDLRPRTSSLKHSIQPRPMEWESGCRSVTRSSRDTMAASGPSRTSGQVSRSRFLFLALLAVQGASRKRLRSRNSRVDMLDDTSARYPQLQVREMHKLGGSGALNPTPDEFLARGLDPVCQCGRNCSEAPWGLETTREANQDIRSSC